MSEAHGTDGPGDRTRVVLASHNAHKLAELQRILGPLVPEVELVGYDGPEPVENGTSFEENALIKARAAAAHTGFPALADDSGIAVDVLGGSPGIFSARWGGPERSDRGNVDLLLWQLSDVAPPHRGARFVCAAALVLPGAPGDDATGKLSNTEHTEPTEHTELGEWPGSILSEIRGDGGFGYDPIFLPDGETRSAAELSPAEKDAFSHRTRAFRRIAPVLRRLVTN